MTNWQYSYAIELLGKGRQAIEQEYNNIQLSIKRTDKRTRNGRMHCIFERAKLFVVQKLLEI